MHETLWYLIVGAVLMGMGVATSALRHLPVSTAMIYLVLGVVLGPAGAGLLDLDLERDARLLREIVEIALLVSLFAIGLRLRVPLTDRLWHVPCRLGLLAMGLTVPLLAACAMLALSRLAPRCCSRRSSRRPTRCSRTTCRCTTRAIAISCASRCRAKAA